MIQPNHSNLDSREIVVDDLNLAANHPDKPSTRSSTSNNTDFSQYADDDGIIRDPEKYQEYLDSLPTAELDGEPFKPNSGDDGGDGIPDFQNLIDDLNQKIQDAYASLFGSTYDKWQEMIENGNHITGILSIWRQLGKDMFGLNNTNALQYAQSIYNTLFTLVDKQLTYDYNLKNWYLQQEYNTPASSIARLVDAGINPAYYFGCLGKSDAGQIGAAQNSQTQPTQYGDNTTDAQRRLASIGGILGSAAGAVGSLVTGGFGGATAGVKNLADATGVLGNLEIQQNLQPHQISQLMSQSASNFATANLNNVTASQTPDMMKAQQYELKERAKNYRQSIETKQREIDSMLEIAQWNNDTSRYSADQSRLASIISANIGAAATRYSADISSSAARYGVQLDLAGKILPHVYTRQRSHTLYDASTNKKLTLSAEEQAEFDAWMLSSKINAKEGAELEWNNKKVVAYDFDTDVLDVVRLGGMNRYFNNFIETGSVFDSKNPLDCTKKSSEFADYMDMVSHAFKYIKKAATSKLTGRLMDDASKGVDTKPLPLYDGSFTFEPINFFNK